MKSEKIRCTGCGADYELSVTDEQEEVGVMCHCGVHTVKKLDAGGTEAGGTEAGGTEADSEADSEAEDIEVPNLKDITIPSYKRS